MATQQIQLGPADIEIGDVFFDGGRKVRVVTKPTAGRYSIYDMRVEVLSLDEVTMSFEEKVTVTREVAD